MISLIDRLTSTLTQDSSLIENILFDVAQLLNSRVFNTKLGDFSQLHRSLLTYGLPDLSEFDRVDTNKTLDLLSDLVKKALENHEPRLTNIHVQTNNTKHGSINFTINATLLNEPEPIEIKFDSFYKTAHQQFDINEHTE